MTLRWSELGFVGKLVELRVFQTEFQIVNIIMKKLLELKNIIFNAVELIPATPVSQSVKA